MSISETGCSTSAIWKWARRAFTCAIFTIALQFTGIIDAQVPLDSLFLRPSDSIVQKLPAADLEVDEEGNVLLLSSMRGLIWKYFAAQEYDSSIVVGGRGAGSEAFNFPTHLFSPNRQTVYVLDVQARRIACLNTNLKPVRHLDFLSLEGDLFANADASLNPISFTAGPTGELYLLNLDDIRIYKLTADGRFQIAFGGVDYGPGSLVTPDDILINAENFIFIPDAGRQHVTVYDFYGVFQYNLPLPVPFRWKKVICFEEYLIYFNAGEMYFYNLITRQGQRVVYPHSITDVTAIADCFYVLSGNKVFLYPLGKKK